jgi:hypothetical protein
MLISRVRQVLMISANVVVDNNSGDKTREAIARLQPNVKNMRYVYEPEQGLSVARNTSTRPRSGLSSFTGEDFRCGSSNS